MVVVSFDEAATQGFSKHCCDGPVSPQKQVSFHNNYSISLTNIMPYMVLAYHHASVEENSMLFPTEPNCCLL
jgi:hypothetical protein